MVLPFLSPFLYPPSFSLFPSLSVSTRMFYVLARRQNAFSPRQFIAAFIFHAKSAANFIVFSIRWGSHFTFKMLLNFSSSQPNPSDWNHISVVYMPLLNMSANCSCPSVCRLFLCLLRVHVPVTCPSDCRLSICLSPVNLFVTCPSVP